jgi:adenosylcobyric acid synthase
MLEVQSGSSCLGVFPYAEDLHVDAEDSLSLSRRARVPAPPGASIAIVQLPRLSNGTDFRLLSWADWVTSPEDVAYDFVIVPGSKDTIADLAWMRARGLDAWIQDQHRRGATVIGVCGGFQMLGEAIHDPEGVESMRGSAQGLGLLPVETVLTLTKATEVRRATTARGHSFPAYEIHMGVTTAARPLPPFARLEDGSAEGVRDDRVIGTYLHGALEDVSVCAELFRVPFAVGAGKPAEYEALAEWFERYAENPETWLG